MVGGGSSNEPPISGAIQTSQPARTQKRGFDKIMAHDLAAEGRLARQLRQAAMLHEGLHRG